MAIDRNKVTAAAQKYIQKGAYAKAIKEYKLIMKEYPDDVRTLLKIGDLEARDGRGGEAARTYNEVADYYVAHGFFPKAVAAYKLLLAVQPENVDAKLRLADLYFQLGLLRDALANFLEVATHFGERGLTEAYLRTLTRVVEIDPDNAGNRIKLAEEFARVGHDDVAAEQFLVAAATLKRTGRFEDYARVMERYVHLVPHDLQRIHDLARVYLQQNRPKRALVRIQSVLRDDPTNPETVDILARALAQLGENDRAVAVLEEIAATFDGERALAARDEICRRILTFDRGHVLARATLGLGAPDTLTFEVLDEDPAPPPLAASAPTPPLPSHETPIDVLAIGQPLELSDAERAEVEKLLSECDVYLKYNLFERALGHLNKVLAIDPLSVAALERRRTALVATGQRELAVSVLVGLAREFATAEPSRALAYLKEAVATIPGHAIATALAAQIQARSASPAPALAQGPTAAAAHPEAAAAAGAPPADDGFGRLDALFADFHAEDTSVGHVALDPAALGAAPDAPAGDVIALDTEEFLPEELDAGLALVDALIEGADFENARTTLFELLGDFPEHAETLLKRMDALPNEPPAATPPSAFDDFSRSESSLRHVDTPASAAGVAGEGFEPADTHVSPRATRSPAGPAFAGSGDDLFAIDDELGDDLDADPEFAAPFASAPHPVVYPAEPPASARPASANPSAVHEPQTARSLPAVAERAYAGPMALGSAPTAPIEPVPAGPIHRPHAAEPAGSGPVNRAAQAAAAILGTATDQARPEETAAGTAERSARRDPFGALDRLLGVSGSFPRATGSQPVVAASPASAPMSPADTPPPAAPPRSDARPAKDSDDLEVEIVEFDDDVAMDDVELEDFDSDPGSRSHPAASTPAPDDLAYELAAARAATDAQIDAPIGRPSSIVVAAFGPSEAALREGDVDLADAIQMRRAGNGMAAMLVLQEAEGGEHACAASFELALANIEMGLYFEGISALEQLLGAPDLDTDDRLLVYYHLGIAYEAMDQAPLAETNFRVVAEAAPETFPDVYIRLHRLANSAVVHA